LNIKDYISSGILEAYVLGELPEKERAELERNLIDHPELQKELAAIEEANEKLFMAASIQPKAEVKLKLFEKIDADKEAKTISISESGTLSFWKFAVAASVTVSVIASILAFNYWSKWKDVSGQLVALVRQNQKMAGDYNQVNQRLDQLEKDIHMMDNPAFKRVVMKGTPNAPQAMASIYWNESSKEVYLKIQNMKELAAESQYQLWAIIDGKPVDAGMFDGNMTGMVKMKEIGKGATMFAVTIEPRGGKSSPTLETMQVAGTIEKG
jgi:anti-sigma-K factor RskA